MIGFGAAYALASLTCTIGPFLAIVVASFRAGSPGAGVALFLAYAAGMGLMVGAAATAVAQASTTAISGMRRAGRWVPPVAGLMMIIVGGYVAYYGWWEIRVLAGAATEDRVVDGAARLQSWLAGGITALGPAGLLVVLLALVAVGLVVQRRRSSRRVSAAREIPRG